MRIPRSYSIELNSSTVSERPQNTEFKQCGCVYLRQSQRARQKEHEQYTSGRILNIFFFIMEGYISNSGKSNTVAMEICHQMWRNQGCHPLL